jgi:hypothetical protein
MCVFNLIPIGFIGTGFILNSLSYDINEKLEKRMSNEKVYLFPSQMYLIKEPNSILQIENDLLSGFRNNPIGYASINKTIQIPKIVYKNVYNILTDKYELKKYIEHEKVKSSIGTQILFPNIHEKLILDSNLLFDKKIKIIINNYDFIKSSSTKNLITKYEKIVKKNIPNFNSDLIVNRFNDFESLELETNLLEENSNLYLMVNCENNKFNITTISGSEKLIIQEKYNKDINFVESLKLLSYTMIGTGIICGIIGVISKN